MRNEKAFDAIVEAALGRGWPKAFTRDLSTHDRQAIDTEIVDGAPFVWLVGPSGTWLLWHATSVNLFDSIVRTHGELGVYVWDGSRLHDMSADIPHARAAFGDSRMAK